MKSLFSFLFAICLTTALTAQEAKKNPQPDPNKVVQIVDASCGQCQFGMPGKSCDLAVKIDGKSYFVDGTKIDDHGDAHAKDGFCEAVKKAEVQGEIADNRFNATYFKIIDPKGGVENMPAGK